MSQREYVRTDPLPTVLCHQHVEPEGGDVGESIKPVIVDLIEDLHIATALLGLDHIRSAVNHLVGDAVGGAAQQAFDTHDIPHRGAQGAGAQEGIVRLGPTQPTELVIGALPHTGQGLSVTGCKSSAPASLERGLRQLQAVAIAVGANFSLSDLQGRYCSARPAGWCEPWRDVMTMLARPIAKARAEHLSRAASNVEEVLACSVLALAAALALCACCLRARPLGECLGGRGQRRLRAANLFKRGACR